MGFVYVVVIVVGVVFDRYVFVVGEGVLYDCMVEVDCGIGVVDVDFGVGWGIYYRVIECVG